MPRPFGFALLAAITIGGMAGTGPGVNASKEVAAQVVLPSPACIQVIERMRESNSRTMELPTRLATVAWRLQGWNLDDLAQGKWVGVVWRKPHANATTASGFFPQMAPGDSACLSFRDRAAGPGTIRLAEATLVNRAGNVIHRYRGGIICKHKAPHGSDPRPERLSAANKCPDGSEVFMSYSEAGAASDTLQFAAPETLIVEFNVGTRGFRASLDSVLNASGFLSPVSRTVTAFQRVAAQPGPWFPCSPYGCCRAFD